MMSRARLSASILRFFLHLADAARHVLARFLLDHLQQLFAGLVAGHLGHALQLRFCASYMTVISFCRLSSLLWRLFRFCSRSSSRS